MKLFEFFRGDNSTRYCNCRHRNCRHRNCRHRNCRSPEDLPGVKKRSFALPYGGGEIWFEHLDGMYQYTDLVIDKLMRDSRIFLLPSKPSQIGFVLDETLITDTIIEKIVELLCEEQKKYMRVCFIGTNRRIERMFRHALHNKSRFAFSFINDFEMAKEWLVSE